MVEGTPFGRYRLVELLGRGGMGEVWRAYDPNHDRFIAVKVLPANLADDEVFQERFRREARAAAGLDDPHVVPIYDSGEIEGRLFVSMKLVNGRDLQGLLDDGPLPPGRSVGILEQIASALHAAHEVDLVHRDVKPSNILVARNDFAYLIDFGIARAAGEAALTSTGATIGTWAYMAPERFRKGTANARADIYALACVLHQALTGQQPFPADTFEQIAVAHLMEPPPRPSTLRPGLPARFDDVIAAGMDKDPDQRYATTVELAAAARAALATAPGPLPPERRRPGPPLTGEDTGTDAATASPDAEWSTPAAEDGATPTPPEPSPTHAEPVEVDDAPPPAATAAATFVATPPLPNPASTQIDSPAGHQAAPAGPPQRRRRTLMLSALGVIIAALVVLGTVLAIKRHQPAPSAPQTSASAPQTSAPAAPTVLPFTGLNNPAGVAVDSTGVVYVTDDGNRVVRLAAGSATQTVLPFTDLSYPTGVAVDSAGAVYVTDYGNNRVVRLAAGSAEPTVLPFTGLHRPWGVAVDGAGAVYVADYLNGRVVRLAAGSATQTELPFTGLGEPKGVAVDSTGAVYVADYLKGRVVRLAAGSATQTELPFTGLNGPDGVAVDSTGAVYVAGRGNNRVEKLAQH